MNRFTVTLGSLSTGVRATSAADTSVSVVRGSSGVTIAYDLAGQRRQAINGVDGSVEDYSYSTDGFLEDTKIDGVLRSRRSEDLLGRVTAYNEWNAAGAASYSRSATYDKDNRVLTQGGSDGTTTNYYYTDASDTTASQTGGGELAKSVNVNGSTVTSDFTYAYWDDAKETMVKDTAYNAALGRNNTLWKPGYSNHAYDVNGHLTQAIDAGSDGALGTADDRSFRYVTDAQGLILLRDEIASGRVNRVERFYYANGVRVGDVGNDGPSRTDYVKAIAQRKVDHKSYTTWTPVASADFDQNYEPVSPLYPGAAPSLYTVRAGDTLQGIARSVWGDSSLWYLIADANGLAGTEILKAGATLTLPNKVTNVHNNAGTFRPYNPGEAIGDTSPTLPAAPPPPKPKKKGGCGGIGMIIVAIVAVVATVLIGPVALAAIQGVMGVGVAATVTAGALTGVAASVLSQSVGMALGVQDKFSWGAVAAGALGGAAMAGLGSLNGGKGLFTGTGSTVLNAATNSVVGQGINIITGQQKSFSWAGVAVSAISAPVSNAISRAVLGGQGPLSS